MGSVAYLYKHRRGERPISLSKVSVILANLDDWRFTRAREAADTNPDVARLVDETGCCLFKIGMGFDEIG